jgi:non-specific serine/threonine protein kinase
MADVSSNDPSATFGEVLRDHRRAAGLTQEELAERAGVSPRSISGLERGDAHIPRRDTVALLARALGLRGTAREKFEQVVDRGRPAARAERPTHNLPRSLTSFVGREQELRDLAAVLGTSPLLTLVGAGGVGKTRLAHELVRLHSTGYVDGARLVELAALADAELLPAAVAAAVGFDDIDTRNMTDKLIEFLEAKQVLLVLDNCEHLVEACAALATRLLRACPHLHVLATSREPLAIAGETTWRVPPLAVPDLQLPLSPERIARSPAVQLFLERARAVDNTLTLDEQNARSVALICARVEGIPLALELAAARARVLTVEQLADRLAYDVGVLGPVSRAGLPQHRTMRATIDWSHDLLGDKERLLLRRLSVFAGGWTLPMAEAVCSDAGVEPTEVLDLLTQLVDRSMIQVNARDATARYFLLEPIRQYASERLDASGEAETYHTRHALTVLELAEHADAGIAGPHEIASLNRYEVEHDNLRAALRWALEHQQCGPAMRAAAALFRFWERRGHYQEGCAWLRQALECAVDAPAVQRGRALNALAFLLWRADDADAARPIAEQALALLRESGTARDIGQALLNLGMIAYFREEPILAVACMEESVLFARQAESVSQVCLGLAFLGRTLLWARGPDYPRTAHVLEESLALAEGAQGRYAAGHALMTLGDLAWRKGDVERALSQWRRALGLRAALADRRGIGGSLERLAWGLAARQRFAGAVWFFAAAEAQHQALGLRLRHDEVADHARLVTAARRQLGPAFDTLWSDGRSTAPEDVVGQALDDARWLEYSAG